MSPNGKTAAAVRSVLLLKAADAKYTEAFQAEDSADVSYAAHFAEVLAFEYVNVDELRHALLHLDEYGALLVTSPRAGVAIQNVVEMMSPEQREQVLTYLRTIAVFSVGKATSLELERYEVICQGDDCGSAVVLASYLHDNDGALPTVCKTKPTLFLCGSKRSDLLPGSFAQRSLPLQELTVYKTCPVQDFDFPPTCLSPDWIVFFSPSGIDAARRLDHTWHYVRKAAIGETTAAAMDKIARETGLSHWTADTVAAKPNAESLFQAIIDFERRKSTQS